MQMAVNRLLADGQLLALRKLLAHKIDAQSTKQNSMHTTSETSVASSYYERLANTFDLNAWRARRE